MHPSTLGLVSSFCFLVCPSPFLGGSGVRCTKHYASLSTGSLLFLLVGRALIGTELEDGAGGGKDLLR